MKLNLESVQEALGSDFQLIRELGGAGMSRVYQARDLKLGRDVVVKVLPPDLASTKSTARFEREIAVTTQLQHPNIIPILETGYIDQSPYYLSPYINGENLRQMIEREGALSLAMIHTVISDLCSALEFAHKSGVVHRDIKPANILISQGRAILADFGVARFYGDNLLTQTDSVPGTLAYQAPERPNDATCDLYALAVVAHEMFSGSRPNLKISVSRLRRKRRKRNKNASFLRELAIASVIAKALSVDPKARFSTATALASAFKEPTVHAMFQLARGIVSPAALFVGVGALGLSAFSQYEAGRAVLVEDRYAMAPLRVAVGTPTLVGASIVEHLENAFGRWKDLQLERLDKQAFITDEDVDLKAALSRSRDIGASALVTSELVLNGASRKLRATVWDVRTRVALRTFVEPVDTNSERLDVALTRLTNAILRGQNTRLPIARQPSLRAWREFDVAQAEEARWDLGGAIRNYENAIRVDGQFASAYLGLARALYWQDSAATAFRSAQAITRAYDLRTELDSLDQLEVSALRNLSNFNYPAACKDYRTLLERSPNSFAGEIGLGDCQARDPFIFRNSSSGIAQFRSSFSEAALSFERAFALQRVRKSEFVVRRLRKVLFTEANQMRAGVDLKGARYLAYMNLVNDTVSFQSPRNAKIQSTPPNTLAAAVATNIARLEPLLLEWIKGDGTNASAHAMLGDLLESAGVTTETGANDVSALEEIRAARHFTPDAVQKIYFARSELRLLLKSSRYESAQQFADSVVTYTTQVPVEARDAFAAIAAVIGRAGVVREQMEQTASTPRQQVFAQGSTVQMAGPVARARASVFAGLLMGICTDSIKQELADLNALVHSNSSSVDSGLVNEAVMEAPMIASAACTKIPYFQVRMANANSTLAALHAIAVGETLVARNYLRTQREMFRKFGRNISLDQVLTDASMMVSIGDTTAAISHLELALNAVMNIAPIALSRPIQFAAFVRAHALAAALASRRHDLNSARRHGRIVALLWTKCDPVLSSIASPLQSNSQ